jgi:hypothetical protein
MFIYTNVCQPAPLLLKDDVHPRPQPGLLCRHGKEQMADLSAGARSGATKEGGSFGWRHPAGGEFNFCRVFKMSQCHSGATLQVGNFFVVKTCFYSVPLSLWSQVPIPRGKKLLIPCTKNITALN